MTIALTLNEQRTYIMRCGDVTAPLQLLMDGTYTDGKSHWSEQGRFLLNVNGEDHPLDIVAATNDTSSLLAMLNQFRERVKELLGVTKAQRKVIECQHIAMKNLAEKAGMPPPPDLPTAYDDEK